MGAVLSSDLHGLANPRVGLLNIGEEDIKGTEELREAHRRLGLAPINYRGFVEGDDIFSGDVDAHDEPDDRTGDEITLDEPALDHVDVVVTDGFAGNVALKTSEGLARFISGVMREEFTRGPMRKLAGVAATPALRALKRRLDPRSYNGASMVGLDGIVIKSHGGADRVAFANAVRVAMTEARNGVPARIAAMLARFAEAGCNAPRAAVS